MSETRSTSLHPVYYVVAAVLLWSTGGLFIKLTTLDAYQVTFFRSLFAGVTVLLLTRKNGLRINLFGLVVSCIYATLLFLFVWATKQTTAANAIFLQYTAPVYILILAPFVIGEKFHIRDLFTVIFCIAGMSLFFIGDLSIGDYQGNLAALGSGVFLGLYIMLLKHPRAVGEKGNRGVGDNQSNGNLSPTPQLPHSSTRLNPVITVIYGNFLLAIVTFPSGITAINTATEGITAGTMPLSVPLTDLFAVAFLGIVQIGIAYILFIKGVSGGTRPLDASIIGFIEPLLNPVWVFLFIGESPSKWALLGGTIIIATVVVHTVAQYRRTP
jgi:drug/metabolite transporter (DMT)-like permease